MLRANDCTSSDVVLRCVQRAHYRLRQLCWPATCRSQPRWHRTRRCVREQWLTKWVWSWQAATCSVTSAPFSLASLSLVPSHNTQTNTLLTTKALFFNRAWLLVGRPLSGRWVLPERPGIPYWLLWQLNGNKNRREKFYALSVAYNIVIGGYSLHIYTVFQKSDAKIQITITTANLILIILLAALIIVLLAQNL